jgi:D-glycero-D-manno-heptose 1,7-bisphosphate phosphatase
VKPAVFIDRDGTLIEEVGYLDHLSRLRVFPFANDAVRLLNRHGFLAVLVTNQAGVARGYFPESFVHEVHGAVRAHLDAGGARLDGLYYCPHHPGASVSAYRQDCACRKPKTGLVDQACRDLAIDRARSWVVGDRYGDVELGWAAGGRGALVKTGHGAGELLHRRERWTRPPDLVAEHLLEAVEHILHAAGKP